MLKVNRSLVNHRLSSFFPSSLASHRLSSSHISQNYSFKQNYTGHGMNLDGNKNNVLNGLRKTNFNSLFNLHRPFTTHVQEYSNRSFIYSTNQISHRSWRGKLTAEYLDSLTQKELLATCSVLSKLNFNTQNNLEQSAICLQLAYRIMEFNAMSRSDFYSFFYAISNYSLAWSNFPENIQDKIFLFLYKAVPQLKPQQLVVILSSCSRLQVNWYDDFYSEIQQVIEQYILQKANKLSFHDKKGIAMQLDKLGFDILDSENSAILNALWIVSSDNALNAPIPHSEVSTNSSDNKSNINSNTIATNTNSTSTMTIEQQQPQQHRTNNRNSTTDTKISDSHLKTPLLRDHHKGVPIPIDGNSFISRKTKITKSTLTNTHSNTTDSASNNINSSVQNITHNKNKQNTKISYTANKSAKYLLTTTKNNEKYSLYYDTTDNGGDITDNISAATDNISDNQTAKSTNSTTDTTTTENSKHKNKQFRNLYLVMQNSIDNGHIPLFVTTLCKYITFVSSVELDNGKIVYYTLKIVHLLTSDGCAAAGKMNTDQLLILLDSLHKLGVMYVDAPETDSVAGSVADRTVYNDISLHADNTATSADNNNDSVSNSSGSSDINSYSHATNGLFETILTRILALHTGIDSSTNIANLTDLSVTTSTDVTNSNANRSSDSNNNSNSNNNSSGSVRLNNVQIIELFHSLANCNVTFPHLSPTLQHNLLSLITSSLISSLDLYELDEILHSFAKLEVMWGDLLPSIQNSFLSVLSNCIATAAAGGSSSSVNNNNSDDSSKHTDNSSFINTRLSLLQSLGTINCFNMSSLAQYNQPLVVDLTMSLMNDIQKYANNSGDSSDNSNSVGKSDSCINDNDGTDSNNVYNNIRYHSDSNSKLSMFLSLLDALYVVQWRHWAMPPAVREKLCDTLYTVLSEKKSSAVGTAKLIDRLGGLRIPYSMFSSDIQTILERDIRAAAPVLTNAHRKNMFFGLVYMGLDKNILGVEDQITRIEQMYIAKVNKWNQTDAQKLAKIQIYLQMKFNASLIMPTLTPLLPSLPYRYIEQLAHYIDLSNNPATTATASTTTATTTTFRRRSATTASTTTATRRRRILNTTSGYNIWAIDEDEEEIYTVKKKPVYRNRVKQQTQKLEEQHDEEQEEEDPETRFNREVYDFDMDYVRGNNLYKYDD